MWPYVPTTPPTPPIAAATQRRCGHRLPEAPSIRCRYERTDHYTHEHIDGDGQLTFRWNHTSRAQRRIGHRKTAGL